MERDGRFLEINEKIFIDSDGSLSRWILLCEESRLLLQQWQGDRTVSQFWSSLNLTSCLEWWMRVVKCLKLSQLIKTVLGSTRGPQALPQDWLKIKSMLESIVHSLLRVQSFILTVITEQCHILEEVPRAIETLYQLPSVYLSCVLFFFLSICLSKAFRRIG